MFFTEAMLPSIFKMFQNSSSSEHVCSTASIKDLLSNCDVGCRTVLCCIKENEKLLCNVIQHLEAVICRCFSCRNFKTFPKKGCRFATLQEINVVKDSLSPNRTTKSLKFLPFIVLRGIIAYICISEISLCLGNALLKELIFTKTYFYSHHEFGQCIKNYFREKLA